MLHSELGRLLWTNLSLLGFQSSTLHGQRYSTQREFQTAMVSGIGSSQRLMEHVFWHMFHLYDPAAFSQKMRGCWPVVDKSTQPKEFRNQVCKWLEQLKKDGLLPPDVPLRRSYLDEGRGERYEKLLLIVSSMVMRAQLIKIGGRGFEESQDFHIPCANDIRKLSSDERQHKKLSLEKQIEEQMSEFSDRHETRQANWREYSTLASEYENGRKTLVDEISKLREFLKESCGSEEGRALAEHKEFADKIVTEWKRIFEILNQPRLVEAFDSLDGLLNNLNRPQIKIDADSILESLAMPESIISTLQKDNVSLRQPNGKTDLTAMFKILHAAIEYPCKQMKMVEVTFSNVEPDNSKFEEFKKRLAELENICHQAKDKCKSLQNNYNEKLSKVSVKMESKTKFDIPPMVKLPEIEFMPSNGDSVKENSAVNKNVISTPLAAQKYLIDARFSKDPAIKRFREIRLSSSARKSLQVSAANRQQNENSSSLNDIKSKLEALKNPRLASTVIEEKENFMCESPNFDAENDAFIADESMILDV